LDLALYCFLTRFARFRDAAMGYFLVIFCNCYFVSEASKKKALHLELTMIFQSGVIATNTIVIPYNRVQHVALHEGFISNFGLPKLKYILQEGVLAHCYSELLWRMPKTSNS
jgi:hypothetical protein